MKTTIKTKTIKAGNGIHTAKGIFRGILKVESNKEGNNFYKILLLGTEFPCHLPTKVKKYLNKHPEKFQGIQTYVGYPRLNKKGIIKKIIINSIEENKSIKEEKWTLIGEWNRHSQSIHIQRSLEKKTLSKIHHYILYPILKDKEIANQLIDKYCYFFECRRIDNKLFLYESKPIACPLYNPDKSNAKTKNIQSKRKRSHPTSKSMVRRYNKPHEFKRG